MAEISISQHFENKDPVVKSIYDRILKESRYGRRPVQTPHEGFITRAWHRLTNLFKKH